MIPQNEPWFGPEEIKAVNDYLSKSPWLIEYKETEKLEKIIADYVGTRYCTMVSNGTVSLIAALSAMGIGRDDIVIVPDYTMIATASAASILGARVEFVDVDLDSLCMGYDSLVNKIEKLALEEERVVSCVILVSINGRYPFQLENIIEYCSEHNIPILEDAAQSLGSFYQKKHVGTFGEIGSFSLNSAKIIGTGNGGFLVTNNQKLDEDIKAIKNFGRREPGVDKSAMMGWNFKFSDLQAVIGIEQMKKLPDRILIKRRNYKLYRELLEDCRGIEFIDTDLKFTTPWMNDILLPTEIRRDKLIKDLSQLGIGSRPFYPALNTQAPFCDCTGFPYSEEVANRGVWLPSSTKLTFPEIEQVCDSIVRVLK